MPSFERLQRSLMLHVHRDDPVAMSRLRHGFEQRDKGRREVAALFLIIYLLFAVALQISSGTPCGH